MPGYGTLPHKTPHEHTQAFPSCQSQSSIQPRLPLEFEFSQLHEWEVKRLGPCARGWGGRAGWLVASLVPPRNNEPQPRVVFYGFSSHLATE